jgi:hypothetical protein
MTLVGEGETSVEVAISGEGETVGTFVGVVVGKVVGVVSDVRIAVGVFWDELSALTGLTLNCNIGQRINTAINNKKDEDVKIIPLESRARGGGFSSSCNVLQS